ncbi:hypothetical protein, partial [Vibrio sp. Y159]|uniref:hypothetical protein n=1 Tax=Vibrio sp. Y159 TaxID=3074703 RepID=UPI002964ADCE
MSQERNIDQSINQYHKSQFASQGFTAYNIPPSSGPHETEGKTERDAGEMIMTVAYNSINESNNIKIIILAIVVQYVA